MFIPRTAAPLHMSAAPLKSFFSLEFLKDYAVHGALSGGVDGRIIWRELTI